MINNGFNIVYVRFGGYIKYFVVFWFNLMLIKSNINWYFI